MALEVCVKDESNRCRDVRGASYPPAEDKMYDSGPRAKEDCYGPLGSKVLIMKPSGAPQPILLNGLRNIEVS